VSGCQHRPASDRHAGFRAQLRNADQWESASPSLAASSGRRADAVPPGCPNAGIRVVSSIQTAPEKAASSGVNRPTARHACWPRSVQPGRGSSESGRRPPVPAPDPVSAPVPRTSPGPSSTTLKEELRHPNVHTPPQGSPRRARVATLGPPDAPRLASPGRQRSACLSCSVVGRWPSSSPGTRAASHRDWLASARWLSSRSQRSVIPLADQAANRRSNSGAPLKPR
jgi:hypothetical protein